MQTQTMQPLPRYSQYTVRLMAPRIWRTLASATQALWPTFGNHRIYQLQPAETESAPNVIRLLSAENECPPKVPIYPHSALKPKPKFGRLLKSVPTWSGGGFKADYSLHLCICHLLPLHVWLSPITACIVMLPSVGGHIMYCTQIQLNHIGNFVFCTWQK